MKILLVALNSSYVHSNLAVRYLRASCLRRNVSAESLEYTINVRRQLIVRDLCSRCPDILAFSVYIWNVGEVLALCADIKKYLPQVKIVLGGPEVSFDAAVVLHNNSAVDYILRGEIEEEFADLMQCLNENSSCEDVAALVWRRNGEVVSNMATQKNAFAAPFPYDDDDEAVCGKIIYYESARGCPYNCSYCLSAAESGVRYRNLDTVIAELSWLIARNPKQIKFVDRTFNCNPQHFLPIARFLATADTSCNFHFEITAELVGEEFVELIATAPAGRFQLEIGLQSFCCPTLRAIGRANDLALIEHNIAKLRDTKNAHLHVDLIAGLPYESYAEFGRSFDIAWRLQADMLQLGFLKMLKGTPLAAQGRAHGYLCSEFAPYEIIANNYISAREIIRLKALEEVLELFANSGRAKLALNYLIEQVGSAFVVFECIGDFWREQRLFLQPHRPAKLYRYLFDAITQKMPQYSENFGELLKKDLYVVERAALNSRELWFNYALQRENVERFFKNTVMREKYCHEFKLDSWRNLRNSFDVGVFVVNRQTEIVLFDYRCSPPREIAVAPEDFFGQEQYVI